VIETFDYPDERTISIKVTYDGWPKKWNEWIGGTSRVRKPIGAAQLELEDVLRNCDTTEGHLIEDDEVLWHVERLCGKRAADDGIQYWVEWAGDYKKSQKY
jgi:hypothetical protein